MTPQGVESVSVSQDIQASALGPQIIRPIHQRPIEPSSPERQNRLDRLDRVTGVVYECEDGTILDPSHDHARLAQLALQRTIEKH